MAVDLVCPECGGIIGATGADGRKPCTCFEAGPDNGKSDTVAIESPVRDLNAGQKICVVCGKDTTGHRRIKDSRGYLCYACAKAERAAETAGKIPCAECGRRVRPDGLVTYEKLRICKRCHEHHKEVKKKSVKQITTKHYELHEKRTLITLSIVFFILLCLVIYATYRWKTRYAPQTKTSAESRLVEPRSNGSLGAQLGLRDA